MTDYKAAERLLSSETPVSGNDWLRFRLLREKVFAEIERQHRNGEGGKMSDGEISVKIFLDNDGEVIWHIWLYCYLIGPHRQYDWEASTFSEVLDKAVADVNKWIEEAKTEDALDRR